MYFSHVSLQIISSVIIFYQGYPWWKFHAYTTDWDSAYQKDVRLGTSQTCMIELFCENSCRLFLPVIVTGQLLFLQESYIIDVWRDPKYT